LDDTIISYPNGYVMNPTLLEQIINEIHMRNLIKLCSNLNISIRVEEKKVKKHTVIQEILQCSQNIDYCDIYDGLTNINVNMSDEQKHIYSILKEIKSDRE